MADQLRRTAMSCAGDPNVSTPHLDRLAQEGVRFQNACVSYPVCVPSRFTFMTGESASTRLVPTIGWRMSPAERTIAHELGAAGYETVYLGKWHLYGAHPNSGPLRRRIGRTYIPRAYRGGFERWRGFEFRNDPFDTYYFVDDDPAPRRLDAYQTDGLFDLAMRFLRAERDRARPFFLVLSVEPPHPPLTAPEAYLERWRGRELTVSPNWVRPNRARAGRGTETPTGGAADPLADLRTYYAMIENLDDNVGRLTEFLTGEGLRDTTAVVVLSDHGDLQGSHGLSGKQHPYEESIGVPFIVSLPAGGIGDGRVLDVPTCTEDWFPTLRGLAGLAPDPSKPGADLTPLLRGERERLDRPGIKLELVAELRAGAPFYDITWRGFRTQRHKYTVRGGATGGEPWQLFDLQKDPYELRNLVGDPDSRAVAAELHGFLRAALASTDDDYTLRPAYGHPGYRLWID